ncbi:MAG: type IX secretion system anionic LPS delivery protein PorZ, partial [Bacteroidia bacterium]
EVGNKVFVATRNGFYSVDKPDLGLITYSKTDGFSDVFAHVFDYSQQYNALFIGYRSGTIDILQNNTIFPIRDLFNDNIEINDFYLNGNICYISHSQGVSEYNINKKEFGDSYKIIGQPGCVQVSSNSVTILNNDIYIASSLGVQKASLNNPFLANCSAWQNINPTACNQLVTFKGMIWGAFADKVLRYYDGTNWVEFHNAGDNINSLEVNHGKLVMARNNNIIVVDENLNIQTVASNQQNHVILDKEGFLWLAKDQFSCIKMNPSTLQTIFIMPNGPATPDAYRLHNFDKTIWVATGGLNEVGGALYNNSGFFSYTADYWTNYNSNTVSNWITFKDVMDIKTSPRTGNQWIGSLDSGLIEFNAEKKEIVKHFNAGNSSLRNADPAKSNPAVSGLEFDDNWNLWVSNYRAQRQLSVFTKDFKWYSFNIGSRKSVTAVTVDKYNQVWLTLPREGGVYVFNYGKTIENPDDGDQVKDLSTASGNGALPDNNVICITEDLEGQIWVGTNNGVGVFAEPSLVFSEYNFDAQQIWVENGDESGYLLAGQAVTCIAVDGGNRKWFGTRNGAYLTSPDGSEILKYFTTKNSQLISNDIKDIKVNGATGEVFFATDKGIVSYRSTATDGLTKHGDVYAYPNPVKPGYTGPIAITGLVRDASVKITDITGKLVFETTAEGGQAVWNGKNFNGEEANSGVYMVFSTSSDGTETAVTKILIVR